MTRDIKENEQSKEAELVRLRTPLPTICIDWSTGPICAPEPIEHSGHVIPFNPPRSGSRGKRKPTANRAFAETPMRNTHARLSCEREAKRAVS